ncbi:MAG: NUDIX domain-containing protein [bacterium]|nr:NUDIX domain-containing protein [bacterium]
MASEPRPPRGEASPEGAVCGAVAVIRRGPAYLMIRRAEGLVAAGAWCFPGGAIEPGESSADAVVRELHEEVGLTGRAVQRVWQWTRPGGDLVLDWWRVEVADVDVTPNPAEVADVRWMTAVQIRDLPDALPGLLEFLAHFDSTS